MCMCFRQAEKREDIKEVLRARGYGRVWDMSEAERQGNFFEGTGVLVLDRVNGVAYVNISERADAGLAQKWAEELGYKVGKPIPCSACKCWLCRLRHTACVISFVHDTIHFCGISQST